MADAALILEWIPVAAPFTEVTIWGTPVLPEGGGYVITHSAHPQLAAKPWAASYGAPGIRIDLGNYETRPQAEAACRRHLEWLRQ